MTSAASPATSSMLTLATELAQLNGSSVGLINPDAFVFSLAELGRALRPQQQPGPWGHCSVAGVEFDERPASSNFASSLREHAILSLAEWGSSAALLKAAQACERANLSEEAQSIFKTCLKRASQEQDAILLKTLAAAGAVSSSKYELGAVCENGGAQLLADPVLADFFVQGFERDLRAKESGYGSNSGPTVAMNFSSIYIFARAPGSFISRLVEACSMVETQKELFNLAGGVRHSRSVNTYFQKKDDKAFWAARARNGSGKCPHDFSEAEAQNAKGNAALFAEALESAMTKAINHPESSAERVGCIAFLSAIVRKDPNLFVRLAQQNASQRFSVQEVCLAQGEKTNESKEPELRKPQLGYFELALLAEAHTTSLQAIADRIGPPNNELIDRLEKKKTLFFGMSTEKGRLWMQSLEGAAISRVQRPVVRI